VILDMEPDEFYWRDSQGKDHLIGTLPERRKDLGVINRSEPT